MHSRRIFAIKTFTSLFLAFTFVAFGPAPAFAQASNASANNHPPAAQTPSAPVADYVVTKPVANMYRKPSLQADVVSQVIFATDVQRVGKKHGWANIRTADAYTGWIQLSNVKKLNGHPYASEGNVVRVAQLSSNIYREPDVTKHAPIVTIPWESRLELLSDRVADGERWLQVRLPDGSTGFVQSGDVTSDFTPLTVDQMIALAKKFIGVTYTWGGTSDFGFDCSGFTQMLMRQRGIIMPRDTYLQAAWSGVAPVERNALLPGDLLFFGSAPNHITHTGMYIGNGQFIHDTVHDHPGVQISILNDEPWTTWLVAARRPKS